MANMDCLSFCFSCYVVLLSQCDVFCNQKCASTKCGQLAKQVADERAKPNVIIDDDIIERWQDIGKAEGLASNAAISRFLISM